MQDILKLSNQLCFPIYQLSKDIVAMYRPLLDELDVTYPQYLVLLVLWEHGQMNVKEIGELIHLDSGTLTPLLKRLEAKEIVVRKRSEADERVVEISLTEFGKQMEEKAVCIPTQLMSKLTLSEEELVQFQSLIQKITKVRQE